MSDNTTIARPYAKAVFELAVDDNQLSGWSSLLATLAQCMLTPEVVQFIRNPSASLDAKIELMSSLSSQAKVDIHEQHVRQLIQLLAENKRLRLIPELYKQYELLRAEQEKTVTVTVDTFSALSSQQQQRLIETLGKRLQRRVTLEINIDQSLLGGARIQAGDMVIDGSVKGQLLKMASSLAE